MTRLAGSGKAPEMSDRGLSNLASTEELAGRDELKYIARVAEKAAYAWRSNLRPFLLYEQCDGAFPALVQDVLVSLLRNSNYSLQPAIGTGHSPWRAAQLDLVDFEWYFDLDSASWLLELAPKQCKEAVLLGTPTVAALAPNRKFRSTLVDISPYISARGLRPSAGLDDSRASIVRWDLSRRPWRAPEPADFILMDPPWYLEHYEAWLHSAVGSLRQGAVLAVVLPQNLTKASAESDNVRLLDILEGIGRVRIERGSLRYVTPSFERSVLRARGLDLPAWRRADVAVVEVTTPHLPFPFESVASPPWTRFKAGDVIVRAQLSGGSRPEEFPVVEPAEDTGSYLLSSVSRSSLRRSRANLVTSSGKAARVRCWGLLPLVLRAIDAGCDVETAVVGAYTSASERRTELLSILEELLV